MAEFDVNDIVNIWNRHSRWYDTLTRRVNAVIERKDQIWLDAAKNAGISRTVVGRFLMGPFGYDEIGDITDNVIVRRDDDYDISWDYINEPDEVTADRARRFVENAKEKAERKASDGASWLLRQFNLLSPSEQDSVRASIDLSSKPVPVNDGIRGPVLDTN